MNLIHMAHCALLAKSLADLLQVPEVKVLYHDDDGVILDENFTYIKRTDVLHQLIKKSSVVYDVQLNIIMINFAKADELVDIFYGMIHEMYKYYQVLHIQDKLNIENETVISSWKQNHMAYDALCFCQHMVNILLNKELNVDITYDSTNHIDFTKQFPKEKVIALFNHHHVDLYYFVNCPL